MSVDLATVPGGVSGWGAMLRQHARSHRVATAGLLLGVLTVVLLLAQGLIQVALGNAPAGLRLALLGGLLSFAANALGALPALLLPGLEAAGAMLDSRMFGAGVVVGGMALGVLLMLGLDSFTPHEHDKTGPCGPGHQRCGRIWLFVFAIALHNLPEGMAIGVGFAQQDLSVGVPLTAAISLQNLPEGLAVALALRSVGLRPLLAVLIAVLSGTLEPFGALLGVGLSSGLEIAYPVGLGLAAGAMLFVVSHEVIPETHRNGHQTAATLGLMGGFALMMVLDTALG